MNLQRGGDRFLVFLVAPFHVGHRRLHRQRLQVFGIDGQYRVDRRLHVRFLVGIHGDLREHELGAGVVRIHLQGALCELHGLRRILVLERLCHADQRRAVIGIDLQRFLKRLRCFGLVVLLQKQQTPLGIDSGIGRRDLGCVPKVRLCVIDLMERPRGARRAQILAGAGLWRIGHQNQRQRAPALRALADAELQEAELERRFPTAVRRGERLQDRFGPRVVATRSHCQRMRNSDQLIFGKCLSNRLNLGVSPATQRFFCGSACRADVLGLLGRDARRDPGRQHDEDDEER
jgi:hypothetical protein